jgi:hypothetical protein
VIYCRIRTDGGVAVLPAIFFTCATTSAGSTIVMRSVAPSGGFGRVIVPA